MDDSSRNTRTLIVSFVLAIMVLIPLRFVEVGQEGTDTPQVLGEQTQQVASVVLPSDGSANKPVLEAPYNEIDGQGVLGAQTKTTECIPLSTAKSELSDYQVKLSAGGLDGRTIDQMVSAVMKIEANTCK